MAEKGRKTSKGKKDLDEESRTLDESSSVSQIYQARLAGELLIKTSRTSRLFSFKQIQSFAPLSVRINALLQLSKASITHLPQHINLLVLKPLLRLLQAVKCRGSIPTQPQR